ncbi:hypothetical protein TWF730_010031 [Orbilia blumenaviensis]|uniref:Uncharacterized protein n=1 Tax=Orbilia blumenaviensis TaxID=1796055 RepID=A0AAV9UWZ0_9PEZI
MKSRLVSKTSLNEAEYVETMKYADQGTGCSEDPKILPPPKPKVICVHNGEIEPKPEYGDPGHDVGDGNYKDGSYGVSYRKKRAMQEKRAKRDVPSQLDELALADAGTSSNE